MFLEEGRYQYVSILVICYASDTIEYDRRRTPGLSNETLNMKHKIRCQPQYREIDRPLNLRLRQPGPIYLQMVGCPAAGVGTAVGVKVGAAVGGCPHTLSNHTVCAVPLLSQLIKLLGPPIIFM